MGELRARIKLGEHEIELEGAADAVERQLESFKQLWLPSAPSSEQKPGAQEAAKAAPATLPLERIMLVRGNIYWPAARASAEDTILVILLGHRVFAQTENVSGIEVMEGLRNAGIRIKRADTIMKKYVRLGLVIASGYHRQLRYRLTLEGVERAQQVARTLIAQLPPPEPTANSASAGS